MRSARRCSRLEQLSAKRQTLAGHDAGHVVAGGFSQVDQALGRWAWSIEYESGCLCVVGLELAHATGHRERTDQQYARDEATDVGPVGDAARRRRVAV